jgi:hypothetical protein
MLKMAFAFCVLSIGSLSCVSAQKMSIVHTQTLDSLGAPQGITAIGEDLFVYGDREIGIMRKYSGDESLSYSGEQYQFTINGENLINHPTGIAWNGKSPTFIGNSIRLNKEGTKWKAVIYAIDWDGLMKTKTLDGNLFATIDDDACIQGTRPEYVTYQGEFMVATADYGAQGNEVRLYDPQALFTAKRTSEPGVLVAKFTCSPWVQNLHWIPEKGILVLIQNQIEGRTWRLTFLDFEASIKIGKEVVLKQVDLDPTDELEGFALFGDKNHGFAVSSSRKNNARLTQITW